MPKLAFNDNERTKTMLSLIPLVGDKKADKLLYVFGSLQGVFNATYKELTQLKGIGDTIANNILNIYTFSR
jgi:ERCC4-type nuclease